MKNIERIKSLIDKVRGLAENGYEGEKQVAVSKLEELKHKLSVIKSNQKRKRSFKLADFKDCKTIMTHCIIDANPDAEIQGDLQKKELYCKLTNDEYNQVCEKFNHFYPLYHKQKEALIRAFIIVNNLGIADYEIEETDDSDIDNIIDFIGIIKTK